MVLNKNGEIKALKNTVPVGNVVVDSLKVFKRVKDDHILSPCGSIGSEVDLVGILAAAVCQCAVSVIGVTLSRNLFVKAQISGCKRVNMVLGLGVDEFVGIGVRVKIDHLFSERDRACSACRSSVVGITFTDVRVSGFVCYGIESVFTVFSDGVP